MIVMAYIKYLSVLLIITREIRNAAWHVLSHFTLHHVMGNQVKHFLTSFVQ